MRYNVFVGGCIMEKKKEIIDENDIYAGKISKEDRALLILAGLFNFPIGIALYFFFKDKKDKEYYAKFAMFGVKGGATLTAILFFGIFISYLLYILI